MTRLILDTNIFFNLEIKMGLGNNPSEIVDRLVELATHPKNINELEIYLSTLVAEELLTFHRDEDIFLKKLFQISKVKSPNIDKINLPSRLFLKIIAEYRENHRQAIRVAEEQLMSAAKDVNGDQLNQKDLQIKTGPHIAKLRERYRQATRWNQIDSVADMEMILLAVELNATIVSADEGLCRWAKEFGVEQLPPQYLATKFI